MKLTLCIKLAVCFFCLTNIAHGAEQKIPPNFHLSDIVKLAEEGFADAQYIIGRTVLLDEELLGEKYKDKAQALEWLDESINQDPFWGTLLAASLEYRGELVLAQTYLQKTVNAGYNEALLDLGHLYYGSKYSKEGNQLAKIYFEAALSRGENGAYYRLGQMYLSGYAGPKNIAKAEEYFKMAINLGILDGYVGMGDLYACIAKPDNKKALELYKEAAHQGSLTAFSKIMGLYKEFGKELNLTERDYVFWRYVTGYRISIPPSNISKNFTKDELKKIQEEAETLVKSFNN